MNVKFYDIQKTTLIDYPGEVAATLFTGGCNLRCPFCHNQELVEGLEDLEPLDWEEIFRFLNKRKNVLGGICITGGEPLIYSDMKEVIDEIHKLGLKVKLDTNGTFPDRLEALKLDFIAMDIKTSLKKYDTLGYIGNKNLQDAIMQSIRYIMSSGIEYEFRTTVVPGLVTIDDIKEIADLVKGASCYALAQFRPQNTLDKNYDSITPYSIDELEAMAAILKKEQIKCIIRANYQSE